MNNTKALIVGMLVALASVCFGQCQGDESKKTIVIDAKYEIAVQAYYQALKRAEQ